MSSNPNTSAPAPLVITAPRIAEALDDATGLIPRIVAPVGITVILSTGGISRPTDWMSIEIRDVTATPPTWSTLVPPFQINLTPVPAVFNRFVNAPMPEFQHGYYELKNTQYRNAAGNIPGPAFDESNPGAFRVDSIAAYAVANTREQPTVPRFNNVAPGEVIDKAFLIREGGLEIVIPANTYGPQPGRFEEGDMIDVYFSPVMDDRPEYLVSGPGVHMLITGATFFLPAAQIVISGLFYIFYTIRDRAGNVSRPSFVDFRTVSLLPDPVPLAPVLPLAPDPIGVGDHLLNIADYLAGIKLHIEEYLNFATGLDRFEWQWDALPFGPLSDPLENFDVVFDNMNDAIRAAYTATLGPQTVSVRYRIDRNGLPFLSPDKLLLLDLSVEGPVRPITLPPGSVNPGLEVARVFGAGAPIEPNILRIDDAEQPVTIRIQLWNIPALPHPMNDIYLLWGATKERVGPFNIGTTAPGTDFVFTIDWAVVARHGNGEQPVSYVVTGPGTSNENPSDVTLVEVIDAVTVILPPAQYLRLDGLGEWSCSSLLTRMPGSPPDLYGELFIPGDPRLVAGNTVDVTITISNDFPGLPPGPFTLPITTPPLTPAQVTNGFNVEVTYRPFLAQVPFGPCEVTYSTITTTGATGHGELAEVYTGFSNPDSFCDREPFVPTP